MSQTHFYQQGHDVALYQLGLDKEAATLIDVPALLDRVIKPIADPIIKRIEQHQFKNLLRDLQQAKIQPGAHPRAVNVTFPNQGLLFKQPGQTISMDKDALRELLQMASKA